MFLIVGLGNPEEKYFKTFHNLGYLAAGDCAELLGVKFKKRNANRSLPKGISKGKRSFSPVP